MTLGLERDDEAGSHLSVGERIGRYRLIHPLGEGGMGVVHLALDPSGRAVAIKVLREHIAHDGDARSRLRREVETLALVQDSRVAAVLDADTEGPRPFIVTKYVPGPSLDLVVSEDGPMQGEGLLRLGRGLWDGLNAIHAAGVIHRDLKPANVILLDGDPVIIDFGIAHVADDVRLTMTGLVMGTPGYLSPEVVEGAPVTEATDWWGWAATLAFAASGAPPFGRGPMHVVLDRVRRGQADLSGVDLRLAPLLQAALSPIPTERPQADEVLHALDLYAEGSSPTRAIPLAGASATQQYARLSPTRALDLAPPAAAGEDLVQGGPGDGQRGAAQDGQRSDLGNSQRSDKSTGDSKRESGQPDPYLAESPRVGTILALLVGVLAIAAIWPVVATGLVVLWSLIARFGDRSMMAVSRRRREGGRRRSDVPLAVVVSPWHAVVAVVATVLALAFPAVVAIGSTFASAYVVAAGTGSNPEPDNSVSVVAGGFLGLLMFWWGPGSPGLRRGSRSLLRAVVPGSRATRVVVTALLVMAAGLGTWAWVRQGQPDWWPWALADFRTLSSFFRRAG